MSREEQIEEMARIIDDNHGFIVSSLETANALYNAGYRKRSEGIANNATTTGEWISAEERLPEGKSPILVTDGEKIIVAYRNWLYRSNGTGKLRCPANYGNGMYVTHWMPIPEVPKMKGGAE